MYCVLVRSCALMGLALVLPGVTLADGVQKLDAAPVRLLSGSPFHDRQELHRRGCPAVAVPELASTCLNPAEVLAGSTR